MTTLTLELANTIIKGVFDRAHELRLKPLGVAVLDAAGHLISFQRQDSNARFRFQLAMGKASGALGFGVSSRKLAEIAAERPSFFVGISPQAPNGIIPAPGGVIFTDQNGNILGAVGVTGDTSDNDEVCALAGIEAANLKALL